MDFALSVLLFELRMNYFLHDNHSALQRGEESR